ncbi:MAG: DNA polymerase IV [Myxococcales bacterium]|nr:DNA polymerase IV [Myxococcales bacterium]
MALRPARICCLDLDTFFVSVERLHDPTLIGKPVVVGAAPGRRGVVTAASYEVRAFGVRSGMAIAEAVRLAPNAIYVPTRSGAYTPFSKQVREILERYCPLVRAASIDEFFLDFSGCERLYRQPADMDGDATIERTVTEIRGVISHELGLPASAGIGTSHAIAKIASGRAKPAGTLMIRMGEEASFLLPLPVRKFPGIGPVAERRLHAVGIETLGDLVQLGPNNRRLSALSARVIAALAPTGSAHWRVERPAFREHDPAGQVVGTISNERTFHADVDDLRKIHKQLCALAERVTWRARRRKVFARTITLKLRYADFQTLSRGRTVPPTDAEGDVLKVVHQLFEAAYTRRVAIRLLGITLSNFSPAERQLPLPFDGRQRPKIGCAVDAVRSQFGFEAIRLGAVADKSSASVSASGSPDNR